MTGGATETIYVALAVDGPPAWRPVMAMRRAGGLFEIVSPNDDPELEPWQFPPGSLVRCEQRELSAGRCLVAVGIQKPRGPKPVR